MNSVIKKSIEKTRDVKNKDLVDNWITSFRMIIKKPYLFIPDIIYVILFYLIAFALAHYSGTLNILKDMIFYGPQHFTQEGLEEFFKSNSFKIIYSLITFVVANFIIGISLFAYKYHMVANLVTGKRNKNLWKQFLLSKKKMIGLVMLKIYTYLILVVAALILILLLSLTNNYLFALPIHVIGLVLVLFLLLFVMLTLYATASLFIEHKRPLAALITSFRFAKKKPFFTLLLILITIGTYTFLAFLSKFIVVPFQLLPVVAYSVIAFLISRAANLVLKVFKTVYVFKNFKH